MTPMRYRRFGRTELQMPVLTLGGMRFQHQWQDLPMKDIPTQNQANLEDIIQRALELGLVDALGNVEDAIATAAEIAGIEGELRVIEYRHTPSLLETWTSAQQSRRGEVALLEWLDAYYEIPQARYVGP